jgi:hypothetical protein
MASLLFLALPQFSITPLALLNLRAERRTQVFPQPSTSTPRAIFER